MRFLLLLLLLATVSCESSPETSEEVVVTSSIENGGGDPSPSSSETETESQTLPEEEDPNKSFEIAMDALENNKLYGEPCEDDGSKLLISGGCSHTHGLECLEGICTCNETLGLYNRSLGRCVGLPDKPCIHQICVSNACCLSPQDICRCGAGFVVEPRSGNCVVDYGGNCASYPRTRCLEGLRCKNGKCVCKYENHQFYSKEEGKCVSFVGGPCTNGEESDGQNSSISIPCVKHSSCSSTQDSHRCLCLEGFVESPERTCDIEYGFPCKTDLTGPGQILGADYVESEDIDYCDRFVPLACINGECRCEDDLKVYDKASMKCRGLVGSICQSSQPDCIRGAKCEGRKRFKDGQGICKCLLNCEYIEENRSCSNCPFEIYHG